MSLELETGLHFMSTRGMRHPVVHHAPSITQEQTASVAGVIPLLLDLEDPRGAVEQMNERYVFGGWRAHDGFRMNQDSSLIYPGDPPLPVRAVMRLREERILVYDYAWVAVVQPDGSFTAARLD